METCKSPRKVIKAAYKLGQQVLPAHSSKFSRQDFTLPQLFACLVIREHQKKSYRGVAALLADCPTWLADIGLRKAPDHNTLWRAFKLLLKPSKAKGLLDLSVQWGKRQGLVKGRVKPVALDSTLFESRHVSRHFEKRQKQTARPTSQKQRKRQADRRRSKVIKALPKLSLAVATASHLIIAARATTGGGGDQPHFEPLLRQARQRACFRRAVGDAGFDSEPNHCLARQQLGIRSIMPAEIGRPAKGGKLPEGCWRRRMRRLLRTKRQRRRCGYTQRWQAETVNSMLKRNLGSALRARTARRRSMELLLRVITHNLMILAAV